MAAPVKKAWSNETDTFDHDEVDGGANFDTSSKIEKSSLSKELLYPEKFSKCYQESKLLIVGKDGVSSDDQKMKTFAVPQSLLLSRLKDFLPKMSQANREMSEKVSEEPSAADSFNIECVDSEQDSHIEMNLSVIPPELLSAENSDEEDSSSEEDSSPDGSGHLHNSSDSKELKIPGHSPHSHGKPRIEELNSGESECNQIT